MAIRTIPPIQPGAELRWLRAALWVLLLGPPLAALFLATGLPLVSDAGWLARDLLSTYICPTPASTYMLLDQPMAVCARCWGATIGLWGGYLLLRRWAPLAARYLALPAAGRALLAALPFLLWYLEIRYWAGAPLWLLLLNGAQAGLAAGLWICAAWPRCFSRRTAVGQHAEAIV
jgi:hypothetical protein